MPKKPNVKRLKEFGNRLNEAINQKGITKKWLAEKLEVSPTAISSYVSGINYPEAYTLLLLAEELGESIDSLMGLRRQPTSDTGLSSDQGDEQTRIVMPHDDKAYYDLRADVIKSAKDRLWIQARVGTDLFNTNADIRELLNPPGVKEIRLLLPSPDYPIAMQLLAQSRGNKAFRNEITTASNIKQAFDGLSSLFETTTVKFHHKFVNDLPHGLVYIADPCSKNGKLLTVPSSFQTEYWQAASLIISQGSDSETDVFNFYVRQFVNLWGDDTNAKFPCIGADKQNRT